MDTIAYNDCYPGGPANGYGSEHPNQLLREHIVLRNRDYSEIGQIAEYDWRCGY